MKKYNSDVCVIGRTLSGLSAAISAAESDVSVLLLDDARLKNDIINLEPGPFAVGSRLARENMVALTPREAFEKMMEHSHWRGDATQVRDFVEASAGCIDWLEKAGIKFNGVVKNFPTAEATAHEVVLGNGVAHAEEQMMLQMEQYAKNLGVTVLCGASLEQLGDRQLRASCYGEPLEASYCSLVLADEGTEYGRSLAIAIGGASSFVVDIKSAEAHGVRDELVSFVAFRQPSVLCVDQNGQRFMNEELMENSAYAGNAFARLPEKAGYSIIDSSIMGHYHKTFFDFISIVKAPSLTCFEQMLRENISAGAEGELFIADSLDALAQQTGINKNNLIKTLDDYNCRNSETEDYFYKDKRYKQLLVGPRYYALRLWEYNSGTVGGVRVNNRYQVVTEDNKSVNGVFCAGSNSCNIYGDSYIPYTPGTMLAFAVHSGKTAGQEAADYAVEHS